MDGEFSGIGVVEGIKLTAAVKKRVSECEVAAISGQAILAVRSSRSSQGTFGVFLLRRLQWDGVASGFAEPAAHARHQGGRFGHFSVRQERIGVAPGAGGAGDFRYAFGHGRRSGGIDHVIP